MTTITYEQAVAAATLAAERQQECTLVSVADKTGYAIGREPDTCNREAIEPQQAAKYEGLWNGGTCVVAKDDVCICILSKQLTDVGHDMLLAVKVCLEKKGLTVVEDGNDLMLVDGGEQMKVASYAYTQLPRCLVETVVHVSIGMEKELIDSVCTKQGKPVMHGLARYGITPEDIIQCVENVLNPDNRTL